MLDTLGCRINQEGSLVRDEYGLSEKYQIPSWDLGLMVEDPDNGRLNAARQLRFCTAEERALQLQSVKASTLPKEVSREASNTGDLMSL